ncbi:MAG TPA: transposase [Methylomirabilota bacterium]|jgi:putative transposase|nr:transposase [Methylomirabilota bacterium]
MVHREPVRKRYPTDLTDEQWVMLKPLLPPARTQHGGTPRRVDLRAVLDTLLYQNRTGCQGEMLPHDLLPQEYGLRLFCAVEGGRNVGQDRAPVADARAEARRTGTHSQCGLQRQSIGQNDRSGGKRMGL